MIRAWAVALMSVGWCLAAPVVTKVEPPDWVSEPQGITLRMLITGSDLAGAAVHGPFSTKQVSVSRSGKHLFVDLVLPPNAKPGHYAMVIVTGSGTTKAPFDVVTPLAPAGRFQGFSADDLIYLIMPDRFANGDTANDDPAISRGLFDRAKRRYYHGGDLRGIMQRLPYLKDLGVTALWLTPVYDNNNKLNEREKYDNQAIADYHGYGAVDFYGVDEHLGTLGQFRELVDKAHALGLKVIQDQVANHTSPSHAWVPDPPTPTWFNGTEARHLSNTWRVWTLMDPHAAYQAQQATLEGWFLGLLPDLNQNDPEMARYLIQNTLWWIGRTGIDGIREDTLPYVPRAFWRDWTAAIKRSYPKVNVVGEVFDADPLLVAFFQGGRKRFDGVDSGVDSVFDFPLNAVLRKVFTGQAPMLDLARLMAHDAVYPDAGKLVTFPDNHDMTRFISLKGASAEGLRNALAFLLTARGIPAIYYGDEIGMAGGEDPDNRRDFPGGWKEDPRNAFEAAGRTAEEQRIFGHVQRLARIRAASEPLRRGRMVSLLVEDQAYAFARVTPRASVLVVCNNAGSAATLRVPLGGAGIKDGATLQDALGEAAAARAQNGAAEVSLPARSLAIYR